MGAGQPIPATARGLTLREAGQTDPLTDWWHPVAWSHQVGSAPRRTVLLGRVLVVWRDAERTPHCFRDLCPHRGTALSLGEVQGDRLVCPYHGWAYRPDGRCVHIPQLPPEKAIPAGAQTMSFRCEERYGIIWVCLGQPRYPIPAFPEYDQAGYRHAHVPPYTWRTSAPRMVENFTDFGHFSFVHEGLLGDPGRTIVAAHDVRVEGHVLHYDYTRPDAANTETFPVFTEEERTDDRRRTRYALHLPYTIVEHIDWGGKDGMVYLFASQPVAENRCVGYCLVARNYNLDQPDEVMQEFERVIFGQDQRVVESQRPSLVPFDLAAEMHMTFDAVAVAYRRSMRAEGLA